MKLLPARTEPFGVPTERRHAPRPASSYSDYRHCLRWDFGFTCALCLTHEVDLFLGGAARWGVVTIEHVFLKNAKTGDPSLANTYANCILACRLCNIARRDKPNVDASGRRLLDPTRTAWSKHFVIVDDELRPASAADRDAQYTAESARRRSWWQTSPSHGPLSTGRQGLPKDR